MIQNQAALRDKLLSGRLIGKAEGKVKGPTFIFFGGIHGNEPAGIMALEKVFKVLEREALSVRGRIYGIRGNLQALMAGRRYLDNDLNRLWTGEKIRNIKAKTSELSSEEQQLLEIDELISEILNTREPPFYFVDIHTTSASTIPFITINDALINRKFSKCFPLPVVLGIEEYLEGPLLSYINEMGYLSLGFESGQHGEKAAVDNAVSFIWIALASAAILSVSEVPQLERHYQQLRTATKDNRCFYEILSRHELLATDTFKMKGGLLNFEIISKGAIIAIHNGVQIAAGRDSIIFMPLYQQQGNEGYFLIRKIPNWALRSSEILRRLNWDAFFTIFPGVSRTGSGKTLKVNSKVARFFIRPIFHLFGYRRSTMDGAKVVMSNRERNSKKDMYSNTSWYKM